MADPYTPWERQESYPDSYSMSGESELEKMIKQRSMGNIRQREGEFPSFYSKLMQLFGVQPKPQVPDVNQFMR